MRNLRKEARPRQAKGRGQHHDSNIGADSYVWFRIERLGFSFAEPGHSGAKDERGKLDTKADFLVAGPCRRPPRNAQTLPILFHTPLHLLRETGTIGVPRR